MTEILEAVQRITSGLARDIGIRRAGSDGDRRAADLLEAELGRICAEVVRHEYRFLVWSPGEEGVLSVGGIDVPTRLGIGCPPTPTEGVRGTLSALGDAVYGLYEPGAAGPAAHLQAYGGPGGKAIPLLWRPLGGVPAGIVGTAEGQRLAAAAREGAPVTFRCKPRLEPGALSWNLEGLLPGDPNRHVIVMAHYDTVYASPGANDNGASCACLPALACRLAQEAAPDRPTLHLLATGAEEIDLQGARCYVRDLQWRGGLGEVILAVNFDSLTWGDRLSLGACDRAASYLSALTEALGAAPRTSYDGTWQRVALGAGGDSAVFHRAGVPTLNANTTGDEKTVSLWHTPDDVLGRVPWSRVCDAVEVFSRFLGRLA